MPSLLLQRPRGQGPVMRNMCVLSLVNGGAAANRERPERNRGVPPDPSQRSLESKRSQQQGNRQKRRETVGKQPQENTTSSPVHLDPSSSPVGQHWAGNYHGGLYNSSPGNAVRATIRKRNNTTSKRSDCRGRGSGSKRAATGQPSEERNWTATLQQAKGSWRAPGQQQQNVQQGSNNILARTGKTPRCDT